MDPLVENEAKLHITNGIEKASGASGVDIKVNTFFLRSKSETVHHFSLIVVNFLMFIFLDGMQTCEGADGQTIWTLFPRGDGRRFQLRSDEAVELEFIPVLLRKAGRASLQMLIDLHHNLNHKVINAADQKSDVVFSFS